MIITEFIKIKISPKNYNYWKNLGYAVGITGGKSGKNTGKEICVNVNHLQKNSCVTVECKCDNCGTVYNQRYSRNVDICHKCRKSSNMKHNSFGSKNIIRFKGDEFPEKIREQILNEGSIKKFADKINVTTAVINNYIKRNNIKIPAYFGNKIILCSDDIKNDISKYSINELAKKYKTSFGTIKRFIDDSNIFKQTKFEEWKNNYLNIISNIEKYSDMNQNNMSLLEIAKTENISYEQLKKAFRETNTPINYIPVFQSNGENELKEYVNNFIFCSSKRFNSEQNNYEIDCFIPNLNIGIEYCGEYWHSDLNKDKKYHQNKWKNCLDNNISLITIFENEWIFKQDIVKSIIKNKIGLSNRIFARKCTVTEISNSVAKRFHETNHIMGHINSKYNYGLYYENNLVSVLSISKARFSKKYDFEITRFSSLLNTTIVGGFSKLLKQFKEKGKLVTYADLRFGNGAVYEKNGFEFIKTTPPNYWYYHTKEIEKGLQSRIKYQKHKLPKNMGNTEFEIMNNLKYFRLYDCGSNEYYIEIK